MSFSGLHIQKSMQTVHIQQSNICFGIGAKPQVFYWHWYRKLLMDYGTRRSLELQGICGSAEAEHPGTCPQPGSASQQDVWMDDRLLILHPAEESEWHQPSVINYCHLCLHTRPKDSQLPGESNIDWFTHHMSRTELVHPVTSFKIQQPVSQIRPTAEGPFWRT